MGALAVGLESAFATAAAPVDRIVAASSATALAQALFLGVLTLLVAAGVRAALRHGSGSRRP